MSIEGLSINGVTHKYKGTALEDNPTELTDIRTGYDDTVYASAGDAVRGQAIKLNNDFAYLEEATESKVNHKWAQGSYVTATGETTTINTRIRCNKFSRSLNKIIINDGYGLFIAAWDSAENYVGQLRSNNTFNKSTGNKFTGEVDMREIISLFPNYIFKFVGVNIDTTVRISTNEGDNFTFCYIGLDALVSETTENINRLSDNSYDNGVPVIHKYLSLDTLLNCEKSLCVHHDNFHRANAQDVGQNGTTAVPMTYEILSNIAEPTIVTSIENNKLVNSGGLQDEKKILAVDSKSIPYKITANIASGYTGIIALDIKDINNFIKLTFDENSLTISEVGEHGINTHSITHNAGVNSISCYVYHDKFYVYVGGKVLTVDCSITTAKCGILFETGVNSKYTNFCVYQMAKMQNNNYDGFAEYATNVTALLGSLSSITQQNSCVIQSEIVNSAQALKFNLDYDGTTVRTEISPNTIREKRFPLTTSVYSFDVYFPDDFTADDLHEIFFQLHGTGDGIVPCLALKVESDNICISIKGAANRITSESTSDEIDHREEIIIEPLTRGSWLNFVLFYKAGYMAEHEPLTALYIDSELKFLSRKTNAYNEPLAAYPKYGIYKSGWGSAPSDVSNRTLYYDNFQIWE